MRCKRAIACAVSINELLGARQWVRALYSPLELSPVIVHHTHGSSLQNPVSTRPRLDTTGDASYPKRVPRKSLVLAIVVAALLLPSSALALNAEATGYLQAEESFHAQLPTVKATTEAAIKATNEEVKTCPDALKSAPRKIALAAAFFLLGDDVVIVVKETYPLYNQLAQQVQAVPTTSPVLQRYASDLTYEAALLGQLAPLETKPCVIFQRWKEDHWSTHFNPWPQIKKGGLAVPKSREKHDAKVAKQAAKYLRSLGLTRSQAKFFNTPLLSQFS